MNAQHYRFHSMKYVSAAEYTQSFVRFKCIMCTRFITLLQYYTRFWGSFILRLFARFRTSAFARHSNAKCRHKTTKVTPCCINIFTSAYLTILNGVMRKLYWKKIFNRLSKTYLFHWPGLISLSSCKISVTYNRKYCRGSMLFFKDNNYN